MLKIKLHSKLIQGFSQYESSELDEGKREDDAKKAFPDKGDLIAYFTDPSRSIDGNKYLMWMVKNATPENKGLVHATVHYYNIILKKGDPDKDKPEFKDINTFKSLEDLEAFVEDYDKSIKQLETEGTKVIYPNDGRWEVIRPLNVQASCKLGTNSRWCIAATKSQNYYKSYTKKGAIFYTILDYSKPIKDKDSLYTYVFLRELPETHRGSQYQPITRFASKMELEIYDAVDNKIKRQYVMDAISPELESKFFDLMKKDLGLGELSSQLENYNHFFARLKRLLKAQKEKPDSSTGAVPETFEFIEEWHDEYTGKTQIFGDKKRALRNIYSLLERIIKLDEKRFKKNIAETLKEKYLNSIPNIAEYIKKLNFNSDWLEDKQKLFDKLKSEEYYDNAGGDILTIDTSYDMYDILHELGEFIELSTVYKNYDGLSDLFKMYLKFNRDPRPDLDKSIQRDKKELIDYFIRYLLKENNPKAIKFLDGYFDDIVDNDEYRIRDTLVQLIPLTNMVKDEELKVKYRTHMAERSLSLIQSSESKREVKNVATAIINLREISPETFDKAMELTDSPLIGLENPALIEANEASVTKMGRAALALYKEENDLPQFYRSCMFIIRTNNLTKEIAQAFINEIALINTSRMRAYVTGNEFQRIILKLESVLGVKFWDELERIEKERDDASLKKSDKKLDESRIFKFNKDYKVFKIL